MEVLIGKENKFLFVCSVHKCSLEKYKNLSFFSENPKDLDCIVLYLLRTRKRNTFMIE